MVGPVTDFSTLPWLFVRGRGPCLAGWRPSRNFFVCACIVHNVVREDKMVGSQVFPSHSRESLIRVALDMPSHRRKPVIPAWSSPPTSLRKKTCCCPGLRGLLPRWIQLQIFQVPGTLSLNTQMRVVPNHMGVSTETPPLRAVYLWSGQSSVHDCRMWVFY